MYIHYVYNMYIYVYNKNIDMYRLGSPVHTHTYTWVRLRTPTCIPIHIIYIG